MVLKKRMEAMAVLKKAALSSIAGLGPEKYPTKIARLSTAINSEGPGAYSYQLEKFRGELARNSAGTGTENGYLWSKRKENKF